MEFLINSKPVIEILSLIATIIGAFSVPLAIYLFYKEKKKQRVEHELATFNELAEEYRDFLKLCLEYPELQVYDYKPDTKVQLNQEQKVKQLIIFEILVSMLESAYFQYRTHSTAFKEAQWSGWNEYMRDWCRRDDFRAAWSEHLGKEFDKDFLEHMRKIFKECEGKHTAAPKPKKSPKPTA